MTSLKSRLPWLLVNLATAFVAAYVVFLYRKIVSKITVLAIFMPIIAGMGGNAGAQTLAVTIRHITLNDVHYSNMVQIVRKEIIVGIVNGLCFGTMVGIIALLNNHSVMIGFVVFLAMIGNLLIAGIMGASVPILLQHFGYDPAVSSSIILTTFTDTLGFLLLLGLGSRFLL
jgi:magnesium transporter